VIKIFDKIKKDPLLSLRIIAQAFNKIFSVNINDCPFDVSIDYKLSLVKNNVKKSIKRNSGEEYI